MPKIIIYYWLKIYDWLRNFFYFLKPLQILWKEKTLFFIWVF